MNFLKRIKNSVVNLFLKRKLDAEMDEEMQSHVELRTQVNIDTGMKPEEARFAALRQFGWTETIKEDCREQRGVRWLENLVQDVRFGARILRKNPGFTAVAVLTLALGIGANTAIFSLINTTLLRALPYPRPGELVVLWSDNPGLQLGTSTLPPANADVAAWREGTRSFAHVAAFTPGTVDLADAGDPERVGATRVTPGFFETLGVTAFMGRTFLPDEDQVGGAPVTLISHGLWQRRFGADPALVGKSIFVNGNKLTVIGIMPPQFDFPRGGEWPSYFPFSGHNDVWLPLRFSVQDWQKRDERSMASIGRLKPGTDLHQAQREMDAFSAAQAQEHPDTHRGWTLKVISLRRQLAAKMETALWILFAAVGLLLLIACVNVANLLLARGAARQKELAVRSALGAAHVRLIRQFLTEALLLSVLGSLLGLAVADGALRLFFRLGAPADSPLNAASLDLSALGFTAMVTLATSVVFGVIPVLQSLKLDLRESLQGGGRSGAGSIRQPVRSWLVGSQTALAILLLVCAGLMARSFLRVQAVNPGFRSDSVLSFEVQLPDARYPDDRSKAAFFPQLFARLEALPGVQVAGAISYLPLGGGNNMGGFLVEGNPSLRPGEEPVAERRVITPEYFAVMGIPLQQGRTVTATDTADQPLVAVINQRMANRFFQEENPLGRRIKIGTDQSSPWRTVIGVAADVKSASLEADTHAQIYLPHAQWPLGQMSVVLLANGDPRALASTVRSKLKELDALLPAAKLQTMQQVVSAATRERRFILALMVFFASTALGLTMIGIYGVVAFLVGRQIREIGIRLALGASRTDILRLILQQGMKPVVAGSLAGLVGSLLAARAVASQLYSVLPWDPLTFAVISALVFFVALLACWLPARRAARVDPTVSLRQE